MERPLGSRYVLETVLGTGGMGEVWRARSHDGTTLAVKLLRAEFSGDADVVARFLQERTILTQVAHRNVVGVRDLVAEGDTLAIVMDFVSGRDARSMLNFRGTLPPAEALSFLASVLDGLAAVHAQGVVHRDLKPENVLLDDATDPATPRVTDFGVSRLLSRTRLTRQTSVIGTPEYMAPEQAEGGEVTPAADLYAAGVLLYELVSGVTPFAGAHPVVVLRRHLEMLPGRLPDLPEPIWSFVRTLMSKDQQQRGPGASAAAEYARQLSFQFQGLPALHRLSEPPAPVPDPERRVATPPPDHRPTHGVTPASSPSPPPSTPSETPPRRKRRLLIPALIGLVVLLAAAGIAFAVTGGDSTKTSATGTGATGNPTGPAPSPSATASLGPPATAMPALVGKSLADGEALLGSGPAPTIVDSPDETQTDGTITAQEPAPGTSLPAPVTLTVARQPIIGYLSDMESVEGSITADVERISGKTYPHSVYFDTSQGQQASSGQYDLGRGWRKFRATIGLDDSSYSGTEALYEVYADGRKISSSTLKLGETKELDLDVADVLRLELRVTRTDAEPECCPTTSAEAAWGDARLLGIPGEAPTPSASPSE